MHTSGNQSSREVQVKEEIEVEIEGEVFMEHWQCNTQ
jgi:hypothetical protein